VEGDAMELLRMDILVIAVILVPTVLVIGMIKGIQKIVGKRMVQNAPREVLHELSRQPNYKVAGEKGIKKNKNRYLKDGLCIYLPLLIVAIVVSVLNRNGIAVFVALLMGIIIAGLVIKDYYRLSGGKVVYEVRAYCSFVSYGKTKGYYLIFYDFLNARYDNCFLPENAISSVQNIVVGGYIDILVTERGGEMKALDFANNGEDSVKRNL